MVSALVAGPGAAEEAGAGDRSDSTPLDAYADLEPEVPFTEWRSLVFSLWTAHRH